MTPLHPSQGRPSLCHMPTFLTLFLAATLVTVSAQSIKPLRHSSGTTVEGKTLYIAGGMEGSSRSNQLVALDLSQPTWSIFNPHWKVLQPLPPDMATGSLQCTLIRSGADLFCGSRGAVFSTYSLANDKWSAIGPLPGPYTSYDHVTAISDPRTGRIIVPTGYIPDVTGQPYGTLSVELTSSNSALATSTPGMQTAGADIPLDLRLYAATWSTERSSVMIYGGFANNKLLEYVPNPPRWSIVSTTGENPGARDSACLVPANQGKTLVLFGGIVGSEALGTIYTLNLTTLVWTKGKDVASDMRRFGHVCATAGDSFVAWGGASRNDTTSTNLADLVVYDLIKGNWTQEFALVSPSRATVPNPDGKDDGGANVGAITGGVVGGLVVVLGLGFFFYRRRKAASNGPKGPPNERVENGKDFEQVPLQDSTFRDSFPPAAPATASLVSRPSPPLPSSSSGPMHSSHDAVKVEAVHSNMAPAIPTRPGGHQQAPFVPVSQYEPSAACQPNTHFVASAYQDNPVKAFASPPPMHSTPPPLRNPQLRTPTDAQYYGTTSTVASTSSNPQQYPQVQTPQEYYSPPPATMSAPGSSPSQGSSVMSPYTHYQDYNQPYPLNTTAAMVPAADTEDSVQRIAREIQQEQKRMERLRLELQIQESQENLERLEAARQAQLLQVQQRQSGYHS